MRHIYAVLYAGDSEQDGMRCGPETTRRCERCIAFIQNNQHCHVTIILGAGIRPDQQHYPPLKNVMKTYLEQRITELQLRNVSFLIVRENAWNTFNESVAMAKVMDGYPNPTKKLFVISSWYHIPRIKMIWKMIRPRIRIIPISARSPKIHSFVVECAAVLKVWQKDYRHWRKNPL